MSMPYPASAVRPKRNKVSDKYSWRLYQAFRRYERYRDFRILAVGRNPVSGIEDMADPYDWTNPRMRLWGALGLMTDGDAGPAMVAPCDAVGERTFEIMGFELLRCQCVGVNEAMASHIVGRARDGGSAPQFADVTDTFAELYHRYGRCLLAMSPGDPHSFHEWEGVDDDTRRCVYCGRHERAAEYTEVITRHRRRWESHEAPAADHHRVPPTAAGYSDDDIVEEDVRYA